MSTTYHVTFKVTMKISKRIVVVDDADDTLATSFVDKLDIVNAIYNDQEFESQLVGYTQVDPIP